MTLPNSFKDPTTWPLQKNLMLFRIVRYQTLKLKNFETKVLQGFKTEKKNKILVQRKSVEENRQRVKLERSEKREKY